MTFEEIGVIGMILKMVMNSQWYSKTGHYPRYLYLYVYLCLYLYLCPILTIMMNSQWSSKAGNHPRLLCELPHLGHMLLVRVPGEGNQLLERELDNQAALIQSVTNI